MDWLLNLQQSLSEVLSFVIFRFGASAVTTWTVLFLGGGFLLLWFAGRYFERWIDKRLFEIDAFGEKFRRRLALFGRFCLFVSGAIWILDASDLDITASQILMYFDSLLNVPVIHIGKTQVTAWTVIYVLSLWLVLIVVTNRLQKWCSDTLLLRSGIERGAGHAISVMVKYVVVSIGFIVILQSAGVDLSALTVLAGALGLGLSFGLQNITSNLVSGLIVLVERPIKVGDRIEVAGITGDVTNIALRATTICTNDNIEIIVPNSEFVSGNIINWSHSSRDVRISVDVGVSYNSDPQQVQKILLAVAKKHEGVLDKPEPSVIFKAFGDSSLDFVLRVFTRTYVTRPTMLQSELNFAIFKEFKKHDIEIPFPQRDLHIRDSVDLRGLSKV